LKVFSFFLALGCAKISYNPQKSKVYTFSADPMYPSPIPFSKVISLFFLQALKIITTDVRNNIFFIFLDKVNNYKFIKKIYSP
jgi:hypothetical protein